MQNQIDFVMWLRYISKFNRFWIWQIAPQYIKEITLILVCGTMFPSLILSISNFLAIFYYDSLFLIWDAPFILNSPFLILKIWSFSLFCREILNLWKRLQTSRHDSFYVCLYLTYLYLNFNSYILKVMHAPNIFHNEKELMHLYWKSFQ